MRIAVAACLCFGTVSAQEQLRVRPAEVQQEDVVAALGALGVDVLRFDFSDFTRENYDVAVYLDEADSTGTERLYTVHAGSAVACRNTGRRFVGVEIDREIFQTALNRITHG